MRKMKEIGQCDTGCGLLHGIVGPGVALVTILLTKFASLLV